VPCGCGSPDNSGALLAGTLSPAIDTISPDSPPSVSMPSSSPDLSVISGGALIDVGLGLTFLLLLGWALRESLRRRGE